MGGHHAGDHDKWKEQVKQYKEARATQAQHDDEEEDEEEEQEPSDVEPDPWEDTLDRTVRVQDKEDTTTGEDQQQDHDNFFGPWAGFACEWNEV